MVAQVIKETFVHEAMSPTPDPSDSDDVLLALETARALEAQGDLREAARWLRRAADEAEKEGNDLRVVTLARAAADLTSAMGARPERSSIQAPMPKPAAWSLAVPSPAATSSPPAPTARVSSVPVPARVSSPPPLPPRASAPPPLTTRSSAPPSGPARSATPVPAKALSAPPAPVAAPLPSTPRLAVAPAPPMPSVADSLAGDGQGIRVSVKRSAMDAALFVVHRLEPGQAVPVGTSEALLVFTAPAGTKT
jgi:hypothetical protein